MTSTDFEWIAEVLASLYVKGDVTGDAINAFVERLGLRYPKFDKDKFAAAYTKYVVMFDPKVSPHG